MKRKVIKQGHNTLTVTLPRRWCDENGIEGGDEIEMEQKGRAIHLGFKGKPPTEKTRLDISTFDVALEKLIYSVYKKGYDEIEIYSSDPKQISKIQKIVLELVVGFEIFRQTRQSCVIKRVMEINASEFDPLIRRTFLLLHSMQEGILKCILDGDKKALRSFRDMETMNNRYTGFCRRLLNKKGYGDYKNEKILYCMVEYLEKVADEYKFMCDLLGDGKNLSLVSKWNVSAFQELISLSKDIEKLYYRFDQKSYLDCYRKRKRLVASLLDDIKRFKYPDSAMNHHLRVLVGCYIDIANFILTMRL